MKKIIIIAIIAIICYNVFFTNDNESEFAETLKDNLQNIVTIKDESYYAGTWQVTKIETEDLLGGDISVETEKSDEYSMFADYFDIKIVMKHDIVNFAYIYSESETNSLNKHTMWSVENGKANIFYIGTIENNVLTITKEQHSGYLGVSPAPLKVKLHLEKISNDQYIPDLFSKTN